MSPTSLATPAPSTSIEAPTSPLSPPTTYNAAFLAGYRAEINRRTVETRGAK